MTAVDPLPRERRQDLDRRVLQAVADVQDSYIAGREPGDVFEELLAHVLSITDSEYGYIGEVLEDDGVPYLKAYAMTDISWDDASRELYEQARRMGGFEFRNLQTLFGAVLTTGEPVIANDAPNDPRSGGRMKGHLPLDRFLGLPLYSEGELVGSVGVSNRPGGYSQELVDRIHPFLSTCGNLVRAFRVRRQLTVSEAERASQSATFAAVVEAAADGIVTFDPASGRISTLNPAAAALLGDDALGCDLRELLGIRALSGDLDVDLVTDGEPRRVAVALSVTDGAGETGVAVLHDITERHRTRAALERARAEAERTSRAKDEFLAAMSHELRTPLNGVLGLTGLLASGQPGPLTDKQTEFVGLIERSGRHLQEVINDLLDLAKIEADQLDITTEPITPREVVAEALEMVRATPAAQGIDLTGSCDGKGQVRADRRRLRQVLLNLLSNAVKFTEQGEVRVTCGRHDDVVRIEVADTGIGIEADRLEQIFDPFQQVDGRLAREHTGTGLGLAVARRLVELHGGTLTVRSTPGTGSTFTIELPAV